MQSNWALAVRLGSAPVPAAVASEDMLYDWVRPDPAAPPAGSNRPAMTPNAAPPRRRSEAGGQRVVVSMDRDPGEPAPGTTDGARAPQNESVRNGPLLTRRRRRTCV